MGCQKANVGISGHTPYRSTQLIEQRPNIPFSQGSHDFDTSLSSLLVRDCIKAIAFVELAEQRLEGMTVRKKMFHARKSKSM